MDSENNLQKKGEKNELQEDLIINPNELVNKSGKEIDYQKLIKFFGTKPIDEALLNRF